MRINKSAEQSQAGYGWNSAPTAVQTVLNRLGDSDEDGKEREENVSATVISPPAPQPIATTLDSRFYVRLDPSFKKRSLDPGQQIAQLAMHLPIAGSGE